MDCVLQVLTRHICVSLSYLAVYYPNFNFLGFGDLITICMNEEL